MILLFLLLFTTPCHAGIVMSFNQAMNTQDERDRLNYDLEAYIGDMHAILVSLQFEPYYPKISERWQQVQFNLMNYRKENNVNRFLYEKEPLKQSHYYQYRIEESLQALEHTLKEIRLEKKQHIYNDALWVNFREIYYVLTDLGNMAMVGSEVHCYSIPLKTSSYRQASANL